MPVIDPRKSSLATRATLIAAAAYFITATLIVFYVGSQLRHNAIEEARSKTRIILSQNQAIRDYYSKDLKPDLSKRLDLSDSYDPALVSSTFAVRRIHRYFREHLPENFYFKESAINARSEDNEADESETEFIQRLNSGADSVPDYSGVREIGGEKYYVYMSRSQTIEESCLKCHGAAEDAPADLVALYGRERSFNYKKGTVISATSVRIPVTAAFEKADRLTLTLALGFVLLFGLFLILNKRIGKTHTDAGSEGNS